MKMLAPLEIAISCNGLDRMIEFYTDILGCRVINVIDMPAEKARVIPLATAGYRVARLQTTNGERIKFLEPVAERTPVPKTDEVMMREHAFYITFIVDDLNALLQVLKSKNVPVLQGYKKVEARPGFFLAFATDPEGNVIEFNEYADLASYRPDLLATQH